MIRYDYVFAYRSKVEPDRMFESSEAARIFDRLQSAAILAGFDHEELRAATKRHNPGLIAVVELYLDAIRDAPIPDEPAPIAKSDHKPSNTDGQG